MKSLRGLWVVLAVLLGIAVVGEMPFARLAPADVEVAGLGFFAWFGFAGALVLILLGLLLGFALKRREGYYDD